MRSAAATTEVGVRHQTNCRSDHNLTSVRPRRGENFIERIVEKRGACDEENVRLRGHGRRLYGVAIERHFVRF
jgi:hypothetical protein